jgi:RNA 2',3'-cyclic 3'-phosphodiesterase
MENMRHRIFIAVNLPENVKKRLSEYQDKWPDLPARWTRKENLHITLIFLGYLPDEELPEICRITEEIASKNSPIPVNLKKICYGPPGKVPPRLVWVEGEKSEALGKLQKNLADSLLSSSSQSADGDKTENRPFLPHLTLARIKTWEFRKIEPAERPAINEDINFTFEANSIEIMESQLKRNGPKYTVLESIPLKF